MSLNEKFTETWRTVKIVLSNKKYLLLTIFSVLIVFAGLYYFIVASIAGNSLKIAIMMSGPGYITETLVSIGLISVLFGIYLSLVVYKISVARAVGKGGVFGVFAGGVGAFGVGCPTCGAFLFSLIGAPLALMYLPFRGAELRIASVLLLGVAVYFAGRSAGGSCEIRKV